MTPRSRRHHGFAIIDLLAVLAVAAVLTSAFVACLAEIRDARHVATSGNNLRTLAAAHAAYAADFDDRQLTFIVDDITRYGNRAGGAVRNYCDREGGHPAVELGWGRQSRDDDDYIWLAYRVCRNCANASLATPVELTGTGCNDQLVGYGSFRLHNAGPLNAYVGGRFYDETFYAPKDEVVLEAIEAGGCFDTPGYCRFADIHSSSGDMPAPSSYCMSPAAMYNPLAFAHDDPDDDDFNGFRDPWTFGRDGGLASPSVSQALYPDLKTRLLEHHWLQNNPGLVCNPDTSRGIYGEDRCEPYYFNHAFASAPLTLFYDGHVAQVLVQDAIDDDALIREQNNPNWGLWSADTEWGADGYFSEESFDGAQTSFHILTTDGIRGRDVLGGAASRAPQPALVRARPERRVVRRGATDTPWAVKLSVTE